MRTISLVALLTIASFTLASTVEAQSTRTITMGIDDRLADVLGPPLGVLLGLVVGAFDLYVVGLGLDRAVRDGDGLPASLGGLELAGGVMHLLAGSALTGFGTIEDDGGFLAAGIGVLTFSAYYLVHGVYSLVDPGSTERDTGTPRVYAAPALRRGGGTFEVFGSF